MSDRELNRIIRELETVNWRPTMFDDVQWYYAEERLYVLRIAGDSKPDGHKPTRYMFLRAPSADAAIAAGLHEIRLKGGQ